MADFEDANSPTWENCIDGQRNLTDALERTISLDTGEKHYSLNDEVAVLFVRPRGWHLEERHFEVDGAPMSGSLFDFGLYFLRNHGAQRALLLPPEARVAPRGAALERRLRLRAGPARRRRSGTIKATVLIETILAAFEMDEILYELREHSAGLNAGRWDYIFSVIKKLGHRPEFVLPDRAAVTMAVPFMRSYCELLVKTCHRRGAHAMGGMAAFIPSRRDPEVNAVALEKVREDKEREASQGFDGTWVAHPDLVPVAMESFDRVLGDRPNQIDRQRDDVEVARRRPARRRRDAGRRHRGGPPQQRLGRDPVPRRLAARVGRRRDQQPDGGRGDRRDLALADLAVAPARPHRRGGRPPDHRRGDREARRRTTTDARAIFERIATEPDYVEFLTLPAYDRLVAAESRASSRGTRRPRRRSRRGRPRGRCDRPGTGVALEVRQSRHPVRDPGLRADRRRASGTRATAAPATPSRSMPRSRPCGEKRQRQRPSSPWSRYASASSSSVARGVVTSAAVTEPRVDRLVRRAEREIAAKALGALGRDRRVDVHRRDRAGRRARRGPGCRDASSATSRPPKLCPIQVAAPMPSASAVSSRSARCVSAVHGASHGRAPVARGGRRRRRALPGSRSARRRKRPPCPVTPCTQTTGAPPASFQVVVWRTATSAAQRRPDQGSSADTSTAV